MKTTGWEVEMKGMKLAIAALLVPAMAFGGIYTGNDSTKLAIVDRAGWTLDSTGLDATTLRLTACAGGDTTVEASAEYGAKVSFTLPTGTWCSARLTYASHLYVDAYGPVGREVHLDMVLNNVDVTFTDSLTVGTSGSARAMIEMGHGTWLEFAESFLDDNEVKDIDPNTSGYNTIRNELRDVRWYLDANGDGLLSAEERANGLFGQS